MEINGRSKNIKNTWSDFAIFKENIIFVHHKHKFVQWCNGSTTDSGPVCPSSNLGWTTKSGKKAGFIFLYFSLVNQKKTVLLCRHKNKPCPMV